jgi:hypothetical protein
MQTEKEIIEAIAKLTIEIRDHYPEMAKYLNEMAVTNPDNEHPDINLKALNDYYESLKMMIDRYAVEHVPAGPHENIEEEKL